MFVSAFSTTKPIPVHSLHTTNTQLFVNQQQGDLAQEAQELLAKAQKLREEINAATEDAPAATATATVATTTTTTTLQKKQSKWSVNYDNDNVDNDDDTQQSTTYRLYLDIGREEGTWMDPRWGASGRRIEGTLDVCFSSSPATKEITDRMVTDNQMGASSPCFTLQAAKWARLKGGFDEMGVVTEQQVGGGYRVDGSSSNMRNSQTLRFYVTVKGIQDGDVSIPEGRLYFSLPCFVKQQQSSTSNGPPQIMLSSKEGIISVRQIGWHTGWRREESRILGVFRAVPIEKAQRVDGY